MASKQSRLELLAEKVRLLDTRRPLGPGIRAALEEAVRALGEQNFGVGASLVRLPAVGGSGIELIEQARNGVFVPRFWSAAHAEMVLLDKFEANRESADPGLVLITTLEPCVMCLARILLSRVRHVVYLAADPEGGGVSCLATFPVDFQRLAQDLVIEQSDWLEASSLAEEIRGIGGDFVAKTLVIQ